MQTASYRRALWIVALLNGGYGLIEMAGGILANSQALKADALDFLGDGAITFLGIVAMTWRPQRRARVALVQGIFLAALGLGVLITTVYRALVALPPEAEVMGLLGAVGLAVNVAAAIVLIPHRSGDVNVQAIWLFSRNDALGNIAVVIAAASVALTGSRWPDLVVAVVIAALFLQSAAAIVRKARVQMRAA